MELHLLDLKGSDTQEVFQKTSILSHSPKRKCSLQEKMTIGQKELTTKVLITFRIS